MEKKSNFKITEQMLRQIIEHAVEVANAAEPRDIVAKMPTWRDTHPRVSDAKLPVDLPWSMDRRKRESDENEQP